MADQKGGITGTSDNCSNTWTDYDSAITAKEKHGVAGIGFKIPDNMYFLDIDGRPLEDSFIQLLLERHDTYAETSPSGNGIHILGICDNDRLPLIKDETKGRITLAREFYQKNPNNHIELYFGHATKIYTARSTDMMEMNSYRVATRVAGSFHYCYPNRASPYSGYGWNLADVAVEPFHTLQKQKCVGTYKTIHGLYGMIIKTVVIATSSSHRLKILYF